MPQAERTAEQLAQQQATVHKLETQRVELLAKFPCQSTTQPASDKVPVLSNLASVAAHSRPLVESPLQRSARRDAEAAWALQEAKEVIQTHIKLLQDYNAVKDVAQGLMGILADKRGVRLVDVMEDLGLSDGE